MANSTQVHQMRCSEVWGGIDFIDLDVRTRGLVASIYSAACHGGRGGDVYYFSVCSSDSLTRVAIADVTGHGEAVSGVSQKLYDLLVQYMNSLDGNEILAALNREANNIGFEAMTTAAIIAFYRADSNLYCSYAGHPPALIRGREEDHWRSVALAGDSGLANLPLGVLAETRYDQQSFPLRSGDRLVLYTDGIVEAPNPSGELFGQRRLIDVLQAQRRARPADQKRAVVDALERHTGGSLDHDDVTLVAIEIA